MEPAYLKFSKKINIFFDNTLRLGYINYHEFMCKLMLELCFNIS